MANITITGGKIEVNEAVRMLLTGHVTRFTVERVEDGPSDVSMIDTVRLAHGERQVELAYVSDRS